MLVSALMLSGATTFVSCKDYDSDGVYNDINDQVNKKFAEIIEQQKKDLADINNKLANIKQCNCTEAAMKELIQKTIDENKAALNQSAIDAVIAELLKENSALNEAIAKSDAVHKLLVEIYGENGDAGMKKQLDDLQRDFNNATAGWTEKTKALTDSVKMALTLAQSDSIRLDDLEEKVKNNRIDIDQLKEDYNKLNNVTIPNLSNDLEQAKSDIITAKGIADEALQKANALDTELRTLIETTKNDILNEVAEKYVSKDDLENLTLGTINEWYNNSGIDNRFTTIENNYKNLIAQLNDTFNRLVTGVIVQGSESPITGYVSTPFGVSMNVLGAYYGKANSHIAFSDGTVVSEHGGPLLSDSESNSGLIFINVNPVNVDPSGITFKLVDSQGNEAPFSLNIVNTDRVLKFGVSRVATNSNGFYALQVKLDEENINKAKTWTNADAAELKAAAKNVLDKLRDRKKNSLNVGDIVSSIESVFNNRLTRYAVKATWKIKNDKGEWVEKSTISELNLAATAINPLSYDFYKDGISYDDLPSIPSLEERLNLKQYTLNYDPIDPSRIKDVTITIPNGKDVTVKEKDGKKVVEVTKDENGNVTNVEFVAENVEVVGEDLLITIDRDEFRRIIDEVNKQIENMVGSANSAIDRFNGWAKRFDNLIDRFEYRLHHPNSYLQPTMLYTTQSGSWNILPTEKVGAVYLKLDGGKASTTFIATSYTAELLAPAYKKYVHVTSAPAGAKATGMNLNQVIDGNTYKIGFEATVPGTYGITYEAVDYSGKTVSKTFYVKVIE